MTRSGNTYSLAKQFIVYYIGFALIPLGLLFYLFLQYDVGQNQIGVSKANLGILILLVGLACLIGFFAMSNVLNKLMRLTDNIRKSVAGSSDKTFLTEMMHQKGDVAELAKSFNSIISNLEDNICELNRTKDTLHQVLSKVGDALASMEDFDSLIRLTLETARDALGASDGAIFSLNPDGSYKLESRVSSSEIDDEDIIKLVGPHLEWVRQQNSILTLPSNGDNSKEATTPFSTPLVCTPLIFHGSVLGAVCLAGKVGGGSFDESELKIIYNLSSQIAISFENMRLNEDRERVYLEAMAALALAVEARDPYSRGHSERVGEYAIKIAESMGRSKEELLVIRDASRLHDVGKIGITDSILQKKAAPLSHDEMRIMQGHPSIGENIIAPLKTFTHLLDPIRHHHERLDGSGYPDGLKGDAIPMITRIIMVCDIFDAMANARPYRKALGKDTALTEITKMTQEGKLDATVTEHLHKIVAEMCSADANAFEAALAV